MNYVVMKLKFKTKLLFGTIQRNSIKIFILSLKTEHKEEIIAYYGQVPGIFEVKKISNKNIHIYIYLYIY